MPRLIWSCALLLGLPACTDKPPGPDSDSTPDSDSAPEPVPTTIDGVTYSCDELGWWYDLFSTGLIGDATLYIYQTGASPPWDEVHPFPATALTVDPDGAWEERYLELAHVEEYRDVEEGSTTLYDCTDDRKATLTWVIVITDPEGAEADCGAWGDDPGYGEGAGCAVL